MSDPDEYRYHIGLGEAYKKMGNLDRAIPEFETFLTLTRQSFPPDTGRDGPYWQIAKIRTQVQVLKKQRAKAKRQKEQQLQTQEAP